MERQNEREELVESLKRIINPERVYVWHDDLHIIVSENSNTSLKDYKILMNDIQYKNWQIAYYLHRRSDVKSYLDEAHIFYSSVFDKANLIYESSTAQMFLPLPDRIENATRKAIRDFTIGYHRAKLFLEGANFYFLKNEKEISAFMLHQATEQTLRTILQVLTKENVRTHIIADLTQYFKKFLPELTWPQTGNIDQEKRLVERLDNAYISSRYTEGYSIEDEDLRDLFPLVKELQITTKQFFDKILWQLLKTHQNV